MRLARVAAAASLVGGLLPLSSMPAACAAEGPSAVLVVDTENAGGEHRFCVALPDDSISGIELIELAAEQHGLDYRLGYGGNVVCVLAGVGYESDECLKEGPEFWGYWRGDGSGGWDWSSTGGRATRVEDGDVEGWSWGSGNDGSSHPEPPGTTFEAVCGERASPDDAESRDTNDERPGEGRDDRKKSPAAAVSTTSAHEGEERQKGARHRDRRRARPEAERDRKEPKRDEAPIEATATFTPSEPAVPLDRDLASAEDEGLPPGALLAAGAAALLLALGLALQRRRSVPR